MASSSSHPPLLFCSSTTALSLFSRGPSLTAANSDSGLVAMTYPSMPSPIVALATDPTLTYVVQSDSAGRTRCLAAKTALERWSYLLPPGVHAVSLIATPILLYSLSSDCTLSCLWLHDGLPVWSCRPGKSPPVKMVLSGALGSPTHLFGATVYGEAFAVDAVSGERAWAATAAAAAAASGSEGGDLSSGYTAVSEASPSEGTVALGRRDGTVELRTVGAESEARWTAVHTSPITAVALAPAAACTGSADGSVAAWSTGSGELLWQGLAFGRVNAVSYFPERDAVATGGDGKSLQMWSAGTGSLVWENKSSTAVIEAVVCHPDGDGPDGDKVLFSGAGGAVTAVEASTGKVVWKNDPGEQVTAVSGNDRYVALCFSSGKVSVVDVAVGRVAVQSRHHRREIVAAAATTSHTLVTAGNDFSVRCMALDGENSLPGEEKWANTTERQPTALHDEHEKLFVGFHGGAVECW